jgi:PAS domain S-box-containing protein
VLRQFEMNSRKDKWSVDYRTDLTTRSGTLLPCDISVSRIDEAGKPAELLIIRGPTDRDQVEEKAMKSKTARQDPPVAPADRSTLKAERSAVWKPDQQVVDKPSVVLYDSYLSVLEAQPDPVAAYDLEGRILYVNTPFCQVFGWRSDELVGKRIDFVPDESWPSTAAAIDSMLKGERIFAFNTRRTTKDGRVLDIELSASLFYDRNGRPEGSIVILRDVSGIKKSKNNLQRSERKFRRLVETMNEGFGILNEEGKILYINRKLQELTGYAKGELVGRRWEEFLNEEGRSILEQVKIGFEQGIWQRFELDFLHKDGGTVTVLVAPSPLLDAGGAARGSFAVYTEISEKKQALLALAKREKELLIENRRLKKTGTAGNPPARQKG